MVSKIQGLLVIILKGCLISYNARLMSWDANMIDCYYNLIN